MPDVFFNGPAGRIEGKYQESQNKTAPAVLILHPHPVYGGTMNNKVVYNTYKTFAENGFTCLRINFRGVGKSQGEFDNGVGELTDAASAMDWLQNNNPMASSFWIAGFSFGAWIGMQLLMRRPEISRFLAVSPPVNKYDFSFLSPCPVPGMIIQGNQDSVVTEESVIEFVDRLSKQKHMQIDYKIINGADHYFRLKLDELREAIDDYIKYSKTFSSDLSSSITNPDDDSDDDDDNKNRRQVMLDDFL